MGNMTLFIVGIAMLSLGTYLMRLGSQAWKPFSVLRTLAGAAFRRRNGITVLRCAGDHLYEGEHFAGMARVLGVAFAVFLAWRKMPLIVVIVAAAVVTALLRMVGIH